jgi:hypothetical protein
MSIEMTVIIQRHLSSRKMYTEHNTDFFPELLALH